MSKRPAYQWYPGDHRRDTGVVASSFEARALWREVLDLMHDGEPYGHLTAGGEAITTAQLARIVGIPTKKAAAWIAELESRSVFSRTADGVIYSRRMVRDEAKRRYQSTEGQKGGSPKLGVEYNVPGYVYAMRRSSDDAIKIGIASQPAKRLYKIRQKFSDQTVDLLASAWTENMGATEAELHRRYAQFSIGGGEWFLLPAPIEAELLNRLKANTGGEAAPALAVAVAPTTSTTKPARAEPEPEPPKVVGSIQPEAPDFDAMSTYAQGITSAANNAITAKWGEQPLALVWSNPTTGQLAADLTRDGVPLDLARSVIASVIQKSKHRDPFRGLAYFEKPIRERWESQKQRRMDRSASTPGAVPDTPAQLEAKSKAEREKLRDQYTAKLRRARDRWRADPANADDVRRIHADAANRFAHVAQTIEGRGDRLAFVNSEEGKAAGFPSFEDWRANLAREKQEPAAASAV